MISAGVESVTGSFWKATFWPYYTGKIIGAIIVKHAEIKADREASERQ
jgi:hypothetical protein